jgi:hypothetical protein
MSALFQTALVFNAFLAWCILGEKLSKADFIGDAIILASVCVCAYFAPTKSVVYGAADIADLAAAPIGFMFLIITFTLLIVLMVAVCLFEKKYPDFGTEVVDVEGSIRSADGTMTGSERKKKFGNRFSIHGTTSGLPGLGGFAAQLIPPARRFSKNERERRNLTKALRVQKRMSISQDGILSHALPLTSAQLEDRLKIVPNSYFVDAETRWEAHNKREETLANEAGDGEDAVVVDIDWLKEETDEYAAAWSTAQPADKEWLAQTARTSKKLKLDAAEAALPGGSRDADDDVPSSIEEYAAAAARARAAGDDAGAGHEGETKRAAATKAEADLAAASATAKAEAAAGKVHVHVHVRGGQAIARLASVAPPIDRKQRRRSLSGLLSSPEVSSKSAEQVEAEADAAAAALALEEAQEEAAKEAAAAAAVAAGGPASPEAARGRRSSKRPSLSDGTLGSSTRHKPKTLAVLPDTFESFMQQLGEALYLPPNSFKLRSAETGETLLTIEEISEGLHIILQLHTGGESARDTIRGEEMKELQQQRRERALTEGSEEERAARSTAPVVAGSLETMLNDVAAADLPDDGRDDGHSQAEIEQGFEQTEQAEEDIKKRRSRRSLSQDADDAMQNLDDAEVLQNLAKQGRGRRRGFDENGPPRSPSPQPLKKSLSRGTGRPGLNAAKKELAEGQPPAKVVAVMMVIYPTVLGLVETMVQVCLKAITSLFTYSLDCGNQVRSRTIVSMHPQCTLGLFLTPFPPLPLQFDTFVAIFLMLLLVVAIALVIVWLRKVYSKFETTECLPIEYGVVMSTSVASGLTFFQEYRSISTPDLLAMMGAILGVMIGIAVTAAGKQK